MEELELKKENGRKRDFVWSGEMKKYELESKGFRAI
jgi:uncharacterized protein Veg